MQREAAETIAMQALAWLTADDSLLSVFLGSTGLQAADLRDRAEDPELLGAVLDFITMDDRWIGSFCASTALSPEAPSAARAALPGGNVPHWT